MMPIYDNNINKISCEEFEAGESTKDTRYFGLASAKVVLKKTCLSHKRRDELLKFLLAFEFVTIINKENNESNNHWLGETTNAFITDINVQLVKNVSIDKSKDDKLPIITDMLPENKQIVQLAKTSFGFSRFLNDPYLPVIKAKNIYADIAGNAFGKPGRFFVVINRMDTLAGFLLFSNHTSNLLSRIELLAINPLYKGHGIGHLLISAMEQHVAQDKIKTIKVGTQLNNIDAINFYLSYGFRLIESNSIYHYWPQKS
jgi:dTDP-4-amino-4,6-dideoxy-D-galactose acyltransferase